MTQEDAERAAKGRQEFLERRADITDRPEHKYLNPEGRLDPGIKKLIKLVEAKAKKKKAVDVVSKLQKKIFTTVLIGAVISALLR
jgi:DNA polymerase III epsilon subunit-like protein